MTAERTYRMELQYQGGGLHGWAKQDGLRTVEGCLQEAFVTILGESPKLRVGGRTDAGVHARKQVVSLRLPRSLDRHKLTRSLNALTPASITVTRLVGTREGFDAWKGAKSRSYRYHISAGHAISPFWREYSWWVKEPLDLEVMKAAAALTLGRHDFRAFTPTITEHTFFARRVSRCAWRARRDGILVLGIEADAFLRHMVRSLVGTMVDLGLGRMALDHFESLLSGADRSDAGLTAPARGLFLWDIKY